MVERVSNAAWLRAQAARAREYERRGQPVPPSLKRLADQVAAIIEITDEGAARAAVDLLVNRHRALN